MLNSHTKLAIDLGEEKLSHLLDNLQELSAELDRPPTTKPAEA